MAVEKDIPLVQLPTTDLLVTQTCTPNLQNSRNEEQAPEQILQGWKWLLVCTAVYVSAFLFGLDNTVTANSQGPIVSSLGGIDKIGWAGVGFLLGSVATMLPLAEAYAIFDIKRVYLSSIVVFEVGSVLCGAAKTMAALIIGRLLSGVGGIGIYIGSLSYMSIYSNPGKRSSYVGGIVTAWAVGLILGPVISGAFAGSKATWRWAFYINLLVAGAASPIYLFLIPSRQPQPGLPLTVKINHMDWLGAVLLAALYTLFIVTVSFDGSTWPWGSRASIGMWVGTGLALIASVTQQYFSILTTSNRRIFRVHFLASRTLVLLYIATSGGAAINFIAFYYIPLYFQFVHGETAIQSSVHLLPFIFLFVFGVTLSGALYTYVGLYSPWFIIGGVCSLTGSALLYTVDRSTAFTKIYGYTVLIGFGRGLCSQIAYTVAAATVSHVEVPAAIGFINMAQMGGAAIGLATASNVFQNIGFLNLKRLLGPHGLSPAEIRASLAGARNAVLLADEALQSKVYDAIAETISLVYVLSIVGSCIVLLGGLAMKWEKAELMSRIESGGGAG